MAQKKHTEIINRIIAEVKLAVLQLNKNTTALKGKQTSLSQDQLNILGGNVYTTAEKTKLASAITDLSAYTTTSALNQLLANKQATLTQDQLAVVNGEVFTSAYKSSVDSFIAGGRYLGEFSVPDGWSIANIKTQLNTDYPSAIAGDHIEIIQAGVNAGDINYITYTKGAASGEWSAGTPKNVHIKGGSVDAYTKTEADARFAPLADVSMDDASIIALEAISITQ